MTDHPPSASDGTVCLKQENTQEADLEAFHRESIEIAEQCMTLLKNEDILPVTASCTDRLIVAGELAEKPNITGSGSGYMNGYMVENPLKNICTLAEKAGIQTEYIPGYRMADKILPLGKKEAGQSCDLQIPQICQSDLVLAFVGHRMAMNQKAMTGRISVCRKNRGTCWTA